MRILGIFPAYEPAWAFGGVVRCTSNLFRAMAKLGTDVSVYTTNADGNGSLLPVPTGTPVNVGGVSVTYFKPTFGPGSVWDSRQLIHRLDETISNFDIVYISAIWQWIGISVGRLARKHKIPYVVGAHGSFFPETFESGRLKKSLYWHSFLKRHLTEAIAVHFTTEYEKNCSQWLLPDKTTFVVPNPIAIDELNSERRDLFKIREEYNIPQDSFVLLTVIRPDPVKRLDILFQAFREIIRIFPKIRLAVVGNCENRYGNRMKKLAKALGVMDRIIWAGYQDQEKLNAWYEASDLFVLISDHENFSMATAEAMAAGLPIVISRKIGLAKDVENYDVGSVVEVDASDVAEAITIYLHNHSGLKQAGRNARKLAEQLYDSEQVARLMLKAFTDVLSGFYSQGLARTDLDRV